MLELFKAKYMRVVEEKSGRDEALIESEQQKLAVARALLDLRLEYSQIQEQFENDKYVALLTPRHTTPHHLTSPRLSP